MDMYLETALKADISQAVSAVTDAAVNETSQQADKIMGGQPVPGSPEWEALSGTPAEAQRELAPQLLQLRIQLIAGIDPLEP